MRFEILSSADKSPWRDGMSATDKLPTRPSGSWIDQKHRLLVYYAKMFSTGMKHRWKERIYLELFSGPGRCFIRDTAQEDSGSPLKVIDREFTRFIFIEQNHDAALALQARLRSHPNADRVEIWCGDCADAIKRISFPRDETLTFAFAAIGHLTTIGANRSVTD